MANKAKRLVWRPQFRSRQERPERGRGAYQRQPKHRTNWKEEE